jgi:hypothetical protein
MFETAGTMPDVIAYTNVTCQPVCVISLDLNRGFERISYDYLFAIPKSYGFSHQFAGQIQHVNSEVRSVVQINAHIQAPIPIRCGFRQGCSLNVMLYALCLVTLICCLEEHLHGVTIQPGQNKT